MKVIPPCGVDGVFGYWRVFMIHNVQQNTLIKRKKVLDYIMDIACVCVCLWNFITQKVLVGPIYNHSTAGATGDARNSTNHNQSSSASVINLVLQIKNNRKESKEWNSRVRYFERNPLKRRHETEKQRNIILEFMIEIKTPQSIVILRQK